MTSGPRRLLAYTFGSHANFEGQLVGAIERIESAGTVRVLDGLFVARAPGSGELSAIVLSDSTASHRVSRVLGVRLDAHDGEVATHKARGGAAGEAVRALAQALAPGSALAAVLLEHARPDVEHAWADDLADAVSRVGGNAVASEVVDA